MAAAAMTVAMFSPQMVDAQDASEKIRLMAETLRARDSGDLETAKMKAEELIKIAPEDENVQRLNASINREIERQNDGAPVYGQAAVEEAAAPAAEEAVAAATEEASVVDQAAAEQESKVAAAEQAIKDAEKLADLGAYEDAKELLDQADASLTLNTATADTIEAVRDAKAEVIYTQAVASADASEFEDAEGYLVEYLAAGGHANKARKLADRLDKHIRNPYEVDINEVSPEYVQTRIKVRELLTTGRAQFLNGDYEGAAATFKEVEARDANNAEAKLFSTKIAEVLGEIHQQNQYKTRSEMLTEVDQQWERPKVFDVTSGPEGPTDKGGATAEKMNKIVIPQVNFAGMELTRVIQTLSELSVEYDVEKVGVNIVPLFDSNANNPRVNISLRNLSLDRILNFVTQQVNFSYDIGEDAVTVSPTGNDAISVASTTEFFPISRATIIRLTGVSDDAGGGGGAVDPFAAPAAGGGGSSDDKTDALKAFFQRAGVNFEIPGASLAFDGEQLIVTQSRRNLERMRTILRNYNEVKQVEIEAKFLEVAQNDLEELGFDWTVGEGAQTIVDEFGAPVLDQFGNPTVAYQRNVSTQGRTLADAFSADTASSAINITDVFGNESSVSTQPPANPSTIDLAANAASLFTATGWSMFGADVNLAIRAIARQSGSDLMSAPKVTVLSGKRANITVAQELRYPESYGDIESTVSSNNNGGAAISITAGTPEDFVVRNVGVELAVTPNVENDDTISLILEPRVTEFEGFVEYGGPSVALASGTTVTVPAGFYQPVFSTREISTEVTIFDGATIVMGGLTRDEVKYIEDKVPVLGDIPALGRLFRSEGETRQKRNLLIFVTANMVSPGGSPARQNTRSVAANSLFQNPTIMTPSGTANRTVENDAAE